MKGAMTTVGVVAVAGWMFWTLSNADPCERVRRGAAPVRIAFDVIRWAGEHWLDAQDRIKLLVWSIEADGAVQNFVGHQFYGDKLQCRSNGKTTPVVEFSEQTQ